MTVWCGPVVTDLEKRCTMLKQRYAVHKRIDKV